MTQEQIERAADLYSANATPTFVDGCFARHATADAFEAGAQWRINSVWHDASEQPRRNTWYIAQIGDSAFDTFTDSANWKSYAKGLNIICWAYLEDLLPNKED